MRQPRRRRQRSCHRISTGVTSTARTTARRTGTSKRMPSDAGKGHKVVGLSFAGRAKARSAPECDCVDHQANCAWNMRVRAWRSPASSRGYHVIPPQHSTQPPEGLRTKPRFMPRPRGPRHDRLQLFRTGPWSVALCVAGVAGSVAARGSTPLVALYGTWSLLPSPAFPPPPFSPPIQAHPAILRRLLGARFAVHGPGQVGPACELRGKTILQ